MNASRHERQKAHYRSLHFDELILTSLNIQLLLFGANGIDGNGSENIYRMS